MNKKHGVVLWILAIVAISAVVIAMARPGTLSIADIGCNLVPITDLDGRAFTSFDEVREAAGVSAVDFPDSMFEERGAVIKDGVVQACVEAEVFG